MSGTDYTAFGSQSHRFDNGGATSGATRNASLTPTNDTLPQRPRDGGPGAGNLRPSGTATVLGNTANVTTIVDNESATLDIARRQPVRRKRAGRRTVGVVTLTIVGTGTGTFALGAGHQPAAAETQSGGTAVSGTDYTAFGSQSHQLRQSAGADETAPRATRA